MATLEQCGQLTDCDGDQCIELHDCADPGLPYSAKFWLGDLTWKLHGQECLVTIGTGYVALVSIDRNDELNRSRDFNVARNILLRNVKIEHILLDQMKDDVIELESSIKMQLLELGTEAARNPANAKCLLDLLRIAQSHFVIDSQFCKDLCSSKLINRSHLKVSCVKYVVIRNAMKCRCTLLLENISDKEWNDGSNFFRAYLQKSLLRHKKAIMENSTPRIKSMIKKLKPQRSILLSSIDIGILCDLEHILHHANFESVMSAILNNFVNRLDAIKFADFFFSLPLANVVYVQVIRSLCEVISSFEQTFDVKHVLRYCKNQWIVVKKPNVINSSTQRCFEMQLNMLANLANHFEPGKATAWKKYPYTFRIKLLEPTDILRCEQHAWLCLADATTFNIFEKDLERLELYSDVLKTLHECWVSEDLHYDQLELSRKITHNLLEFVALVEHELNVKQVKLHEEVFRKQSNILRSLPNQQKALNLLCQRIAVFKNNWELVLLSSLSNLFKGNYLNPLMDEVKGMSMELIYHALDKEINPESIVDFLAVCNNFLAGLDGFPFEWYLRFANERMKNVLLEAKIITSTNTQLSRTKYESFKVSKHYYKTFTELCSMEEISKHFQMDVVRVLLKYTIVLMQKRRWSNGDKLLSNHDQIITATLMLNVFRDAFVFLKKQPNYLNFDIFYEEFIKPFRDAVEKSNSLEHFTKRVEEIGKYLEDIHRENAILIENRLIPLQVKSPLKHCKKLMDADRDQYVELHGSDSVGLPYSAKFRFRNSYWKLHGAECLITVGPNYVAKARIKCTVGLNESSDFHSARQILLRNIEIEEVLKPQNWANFLSTQWRKMSVQRWTSTGTPNWLDLIRLFNTWTSNQKKPNNRPYSEASDNFRIKQQSLNPRTMEALRAKMYGWTLMHRGQLTDGNAKQYIKHRKPNSSGIPYSAVIDHDGSTWRLHGRECLITNGSSFVAQVSMQSIAELNNESNFNSAKMILLKEMKIDKVLLDELQKRTANALESFRSELFRLGTESATNVNSGRCLLELWRISELHQNRMTEAFAGDVVSNAFVKSEKLKLAINDYVGSSSKLEKRSLFQRGWKAFKKIIQNNECFKDILGQVYMKYKSYLLNLCSVPIGSKLCNLELCCFMMLREDDVKLFNDLECSLKDTVISVALPQILDRFVERINALKHNDYCNSLPLVNGVYFSICKGMVEIENRLISEHPGIVSVIDYKNGQWTMTFPAKNQMKSILSKCFEKQLEMLMKLANHFEPGKPTVRLNYPYDMQIELLKPAESSCSEHLIWLYVADFTMVYIFQKDLHRINEYSSVAEMLKSCLSSEDLRSESLESIRTLTHNTLELVAQIEQSGYGLNEMNKMFLDRQICFMRQSFLGDRIAFTQYRAVTDVFKDFWERFNDILPTIPSLDQQNHEIKPKLMELISHVLNKTIHSDGITKFFRSFNDFLMDLKELNFEWYVRIRDEAIKNSLLEQNVITKVKNSLRGSFNECYQVSKQTSEFFVKICARIGVPKHYQIEIVCEFLEYMIGLIRKSQWKNDRVLTEEDQLNATVLLINAIRSSLMYLKEQPLYVDFDKFFEETVKPFCSVIEDSDSMENFTKRVSLIKDSFWYIRNQNSIGIDMALELCSRDNDDFNESILKSCFELYNDQFEIYLLGNSELDSDKRILSIVHAVHEKVHPTFSSTWTEELKQTTIPKILAGLGAVWSIMVSMDVAYSGNYLKPHPIQILSVLRLLCVDDKTTGVDKHLAQILTGQGKSLTLGLVAAILALYGHKVDVVCYSKYLTERDSDDFCGFFKKFSIKSKISYKTIDDVVCDQIRTLSGRSEQYIRKCIGLPYSKYSTNEDDLTDSVLLIDEVDVFFIDTFYGNTSDYGKTLNIKGLGHIQQMIWELVQCYPNDVENRVRQFIDSSYTSDIVEFRSLMYRNGSYFLYDHDKASSNMYTNESLFLKHLRSMISFAQNVHNRTIDDIFFCNFRIDDSGKIETTDNLGQFSHCLRGYFNTFVYFKLRKTAFIEKVGASLNFGYLILDSASFSYSKLPESYPLILGVTGTLTGLSPYEKNAIENNYNIKRRSIMPSYFGGTNLIFSQTENFQCLLDESSWRRMIFTRVNSIINANRSVIVFFEDEIEINRFTRLFENQLDRLHKITINTDPGIRERYIAEAGLTRTVTLGSRAMGRGVDYKSSLLVEKNGGIHVIQTFFSLDDKEETQIKGRTARKDHLGSYELIVCQSHLKKINLINSNMHLNEINYTYLKASRVRNTSTASEGKKRKLQESNRKHAESIRFYQNI
ncbi:uncharacterized protein LOC134218118 [Armigeres subalbatus]|uniref:uncharacterized protein LOC134218118 n=1 Tax=Armigeres subalbatus TaxID=124917 RepID=UPI002ED258F8